MEKLLQRLGGIQIGQLADEVEFLDEGKTKQWSLKWRDGMCDVRPELNRQLHFQDQGNQNCWFLAKYFFLHNLFWFTK